jgi:hypothetical protein
MNQNDNSIGLEAELENIRREEPSQFLKNLIFTVV